MIHPSLEKLHQEFIAESRYGARRSERTLTAKEGAFSMLQELMPGLTLERLTAEVMTEFFRRLNERPRIVGRARIKRGVTASTIVTYLGRLNGFFVWLIKKGYLEHNPLAGLERPRVSYDNRKYLSRDQVERLFSSVALLSDDRVFTRKRNMAILQLLLFCGLRKGELLGLRMYDIDMSARHVVLRSETSKSGRQRVVPMNHTLARTLADYIEIRRRKGYKCPFFFVSGVRDGELTGHGLRHIVKMMKKTSGVEFHLHQLRHTFAVNLLNKGVDIAKVKHLLGHRDIRATMLYLRCLPTKAVRDDVELLAIDTLL